MKIGGRQIGRTTLPFVIAEMSGNHNQSLGRALARMTKGDPKRPGWSAPTNCVRWQNMQEPNRITLNPEICHGKPCIRGLRYPVENVLEWLAGGMSIDDILADYEDLEREDILAVLAYAARIAHVKSINRLAA